MSPLSLFEENQAAALLCLEAIVNLGPEPAEVIDGGNDSKHNDHVEHEIAQLLKNGIWGIAGHSQNEKRYGRNLRDHFYFAELRRVDRETLSRRNAP
jgi:hypothetical protein